ncbi:MAG: oligoendopeptidase F, partial [Alphaproteobacteria bacterium]|nr:oligoendopeptidase F [Alphaproteobacteria bacterium]
MSLDDPFAVEAEKNPYGELPEWNLADLYPGRDSPELKEALSRAEALSKAFAERWRGKLAEIAAGPEAGSKLAEAVREFENLDDLIGRIISFAGLLHAGDTVDPA